MEPEPMITTTNKRPTSFLSLSPDQPQSPTSAAAAAGNDRPSQDSDLKSAKINQSVASILSPNMSQSPPKVTYGLGDISTTEPRRASSVSSASSGTSGVIGGLAEEKKRFLKLGHAPDAEAGLGLSDWAEEE